MPDSPSPVPTPTPAPEPTPVPQVVTKKHRLTIITAIVVVIILLVAIGGGVMFVLWRSNQASKPPASRPVAAIPSVSIAPIPSSSPATSGIPDRATQLAQNQHNLVVTISYTSIPQFKLAVANLERTYQVDSSDLYAPVPGGPSSTLKVYDTTGQVIVTRPFAVSTAVIAEGEGQTGGESALATSEAVLNLVIPANQMPQKVEIVSGSGQVLDSRTFDFDQLPVRFDARLGTQL